MTVHAPLVITAAGDIMRLPPGDQLTGLSAVAPSVLAYAPTITLDAAVGRVFELGVITGDVSLAFVNLSAGCSGSVWVKQDPIGGWRIGFATPAGWVVSGDLSAALGANAITRYMFAAVVVDGVSYLDIDSSTRAATVNTVVSGTSQVVNGADRVVA